MIKTDGILVGLLESEGEAVGSLDAIIKTKSLVGVNRQILLLERKLDEWQIYVCF